MNQHVACAIVVEQLGLAFDEADAANFRLDAGDAQLTDRRIEVALVRGPCTCSLCIGDVIQAVDLCHGSCNFRYGGILLVDMVKCVRVEPFDAVTAVHVDVVLCLCCKLVNQDVAEAFRHGAVRAAREGVVEVFAVDGIDEGLLCLKRREVALRHADDGACQIFGLYVVIQFQIGADARIFRAVDAGRDAEDGAVLLSGDDVIGQQSFASLAVCHLVICDEFISSVDFSV